MKKGLLLMVCVLAAFCYSFTAFAKEGMRVNKDGIVRFIDESEWPEATDEQAEACKEENIGTEVPKDVKKQWKKTGFFHKTQYTTYNQVLVCRIFSDDAQGINNLKIEERDLPTVQVEQGETYLFFYNIFIVAAMFLMALGTVAFTKKRRKIFVSTTITSIVLFGITLFITLGFFATTFYVFISYTAIVEKRNSPLSTYIYISIFYVAAIIAIIIY